MKIGKKFLFGAALMLSTNAMAQNHVVYSDNIASLQVVAGTRWTSPLPVIQLRGNEVINIAFDDLTHEYHRYTYKLEHCEANWEVSQGLLTSDFAEGFTEGIAIDDVEESVNTNLLYSHYALQIPNNDCRIKMSGNYKVTVYDENDDNTPVFTACFMVVEPVAGVQLTVTGNTDIDINGKHQQVDMQVKYGNLRVTDPANQIQSVVLQNGNWHTAVVNQQPQYIMNDGLQWNHNRALIFDAGNEYHKFETLDVNHTTMGIESIDWDGEWFNAYIWTDEPRYNYVYDEDANGCFYIRNSDNDNNDTFSEYLKVHFRLKTPYCGRHIYINGKFTNGIFDERYEMEWNQDTGQYEKILELKQGYYSYQYLVEMAPGNYKPVDTEGNFFQTENEYSALVYYKGIGERTDRLVGYQNVSFK